MEIRQQLGKTSMSCPARGMGVEIRHVIHAVLAPSSCPARGMGVEIINGRLGKLCPSSCPARGMGVEMLTSPVTPRNAPASCPARGMGVEIPVDPDNPGVRIVMPREGHGSRNVIALLQLFLLLCHAPRGAWE